MGVPSAQSTPKMTKMMFTPNLQRTTAAEYEEAFGVTPRYGLRRFDQRPVFQSY
jgi:hypothetical protein